MESKKRMNNRLLNPSCDQKSVSGRTVARWKKMFADVAKKSKIESSSKETVNDQNCDSSDSNLSSVPINDSWLCVDDEATNTGDNIIIDVNYDSTNDDVSSSCSSDDAYSVCSCCKDDISSDEECNIDIGETLRYDKATFDTNQIDGDRIMFPAANLRESDVVLMVEMFSISKNLTKSDQNELLQLVKILAGPDFEAWECSYYMRNKVYGISNDKITLHFFCENCNVILKNKGLKDSLKNEKVQCDSCKEAFTVSSQVNNYFMSVDIRYQIQLILNQPENQVSLFIHIATKSQSSDIYDIQDSNLYKQLKSKHPDMLTLNYNTDGAPIFKSSKQSFWPQQLCISELPLERRFKHIILGGLFLTNKEPKSRFINLYNEELCNQIVDLMTNGVDIFNHETGEIINLKFTLICCCVDTPARATCQNRVKFNGYWGCSWCYERGLYVGNAVHYPLNEIVPELRTHGNHIANILEVERIKKSSELKNNSLTVMGVKGSIPFVDKLPLFDSIWGFPIDYMHGCLLGVTRQLLELLKTPGVKFKLNKRQHKIIDQRLTSIKPPHEIYRLPRPTADMCKWKASEFESWLLYWSLPCLDGIVDPVFLEMYALFVRSVYTLLKRKITDEDIARCEYDLVKFVGNFQIEFSKAPTTFNIHSLLHLCKSVKETGPLTGTSAFSFENGIFNLKKKVSGPRSVSHQIVKKVLKTNTLLSQLESLTTSSQCKNYCKELFNHDQLKDCIELPGGILLTGKTRINQCITDKIKNMINNNNAAIQVYKKCIFKRRVIHCTEYTRATKTNDTYVQLNSNQVIHVHNLVVSNEKCNAYGCSLNIIPYSAGCVEIDHIYRITNECGDDIIITNIENFQEKVIHVKINEYQYICSFPCILNMN